jgi:DNA polymerase/3'-5' exonuclease PolX
MPRYIAPGPLAVNKRIAERLFLRTYDLELERASDHSIWAYRKAAWVVDEYKESVADIYTTSGEGGLQELPNIGRSIARRIVRWLDAWESEVG